MKMVTDIAGSLLQCEDYWALNLATIKRRYTLAHMSEILDRVHGAQIFTFSRVWGFLLPAIIVLVTSVSNGSKLVVRFRVRVGTELEPVDGVLPHQKTEPHRAHGFLAGSTLPQTQNFDSNEVFEL
jgi:hypothetical protein